MIIAVLIFTQGWAFAGETKKQKPLKAIPKVYADKKMPEAWWTDEKIIAEGKKIFETTVMKYKFKRKTRIANNGCATCHGIDEKTDRPKKRGAPDFRVSKRVARFSDAYWFWRVSEGVAKTRMPPWKTTLSESEIWKTIAYQHTWSHGNKPALHDHEEIEYSVNKTNGLQQKLHTQALRVKDHRPDKPVAPLRDAVALQSGHSRQFDRSPSHTPDRPDSMPRVHSARLKEWSCPVC